MSETTIDWRRTSGRTWEVTIDRRTAEEREQDAYNLRMWASMQAYMGPLTPLSWQAQAPSDCGATYQGMVPAPMLGGLLSPL